MNKIIRKTISGYRTCRDFLQEDLWTKDTSAFPCLKQALFAICRIVMIVIRRFREDRCSLQASALTYITLVSLVPVLAIMFSFSKGIGMQNSLLESIGIERLQTLDEQQMPHVEFRILAPKESTEDNEVTAAPPGTFIAHKLPPPMQEAILRILDYVEHTNFAALGLIGSLVLLFSVIGSLSKLENSLNDIWGVKIPRTFFRKATEYLVILILCPIVLLVATSLNTLLLSHHVLGFLNQHFGAGVPILQFLVHSCSALAILLAFAFFYRFMPNTKVHFLPSFIAGCITGICWFIVQWAYLSLQVGLTRFNSIYGTFAIVPFFLAWLYANWSIILFGAVLSYAIQNHRTIHIEKASENSSAGLCIVIAQLIMFEVCKAFHTGKGPWNAIAFGNNNNVPLQLLLHVLDVMAQNGLLVKTENSTKNSIFYLPGRDINVLSPADIEEAFRQNQSLNTRSYLRDLPQALRDNYINSYTSFCQGLACLTFGELVQNKLP